MNRPTQAEASQCIHLLEKHLLDTPGMARRDREALRHVQFWLEDEFLPMFWRSSYSRRVVDIVRLEHEETAGAAA